MTTAKVSLQSLETMEREQLFQLRLCDINFLLSRQSVVSQAITQLYRELKIKRLSFRPAVWLSDEWFCPDGTAGFALPFYLLSPRLMRLEKTMTGVAEGSKPLELMKLLRHETGHALDNAFHLRKSKKRQQVFGKSSKPYPLSYKPNMRSRSYVRHLGAGYAQAHPDEDWAETFAVWATPGSDWRRYYQTTPAMNKLLLVDEMMANIACLPAKNTNCRPVEEISGNTMTLAQYYRKRQKQLKVRQESPLYKKARMAFDCAGDLPAWRFICEHENYLTQEVAKKSLLPQYKINELLRDFKMACKHDHFRLSSAHSAKRANLQTMVRLMSHPQVIATQTRIQM